MELRHLRYFVAVAEERHVGRAAARLRVAQPPLSRQLQDLERELGAALFVRHPRGMALTPAGDAFLAHARALLAEAARAVAHVRRVGTDRQVLRVGLVDFGPGELIVPAAVAAYRAAYPYVALTVDPTPTLRQRARVRDGQLDIGFDLGHTPEGPGLAVERLTADPITHVLLPVADPRPPWDVDAPDGSADTPVDPARLSHLPSLCFARELIPRLREDDEARRRAAGYRGVDGPILEDAGQIRRLVAAGAGCAFGPAALGQGPHTPGTRYLPLAGGGGAPMDVLVLTRTGEGGPGGDPLAAAFLTCLREARDAIVGVIPTDSGPPGVR